AEIGQAAGGPQPPHHFRRGGARVDIWIPRQDLQHPEVERLGRRAHLAAYRPALERPDQGLDTAEIELAFAPVEKVERREAMLLDPFDLFGPELGEGVALQGQAAERA